MNKLSASNNERLIQLDVREQLLDEEIELVVKQNEKVLANHRKPSPPKKTRSSNRKLAVRSNAGGCCSGASLGTPEKEDRGGSGPPATSAQDEETSSNKAPNNAQEGSATVNVNCVWSESDDRIFLGELYSILNRRMNNSSSNGINAATACHTLRRDGSSSRADLSSKRDGNQPVQIDPTTRGNNFEDKNNNINGEHHDKITPNCQE